jgi:glycosyltransferase involved in cell wall biosynthesis
MYGMVVTSTWKGNKWAKYAGNWAASGSMAVSHRFQRDWLRRGWFGGPVTVNGRWPGQQEYVYSFDNPSLTLGEVREAQRRVGAKRLGTPVRLVFVGRTAAAKGLGVALQVVRRLIDGAVGESGVDLTLDVLGDGPEKPNFERLCEQLGLSSVVRFHGWVAHDRVLALLQDAHFILLPSKTEGWPKVLSEAMAYGVVPISSQVSAIPQVLAEVGSGIALPLLDVAGFALAIRNIVEDAGLWKEMVEAGLRAAPRFTYERYLLRLDEMLALSYGVSPFDPDFMDRVRAQWDATGGQ